MKLVMLLVLALALEDPRHDRVPLFLNLRALKSA